MGMEERKSAKLFGKKNQSTNGSDGEMGTGIGLMPCKDFADRMEAAMEAGIQSIQGQVLLSNRTKPMSQFLKIADSKISYDHFIDMHKK